MKRLIDDVLWLAREGRGIDETVAAALQPVIEDVWSIVADDRRNAELIPRRQFGWMEPDQC
jgi:hypothetical protein